MSEDMDLHTVANMTYGPRDYQEGRGKMRRSKILYGDRTKGQKVTIEGIER